MWVDWTDHNWKTGGKSLNENNDRHDDDDDGNDEPEVKGSAINYVLFQYTLKTIERWTK